MEICLATLHATCKHATTCAQVVRKHGLIRPHDFFVNSSNAASSPDLIVPQIVQ
eukprot:m.833250 g.833250  ORF g.833250 m.833250 type:complete len:54 (+) comp23442_c0_seq4:1991-2152(+)